MSVSTFATTLPLIGSIPAYSCVPPTIAGSIATHEQYTTTPVDAAFTAYQSAHDQPVASHGISRDARDAIAHQLTALGHHIHDARRSHQEQRWNDVEASYAAALKILESPPRSAKPTSAPLYQTITAGSELHREASFGYAAFAQATNAIDILTRLHRIKRELKGTTDFPSRQYDLIRIELLRAFTLMQYTAATPIQRVERYEQSESIVRELLVSDSLKPYPELAFSARILLVELVARQAERAHHRGDKRTRRHLLHQLASQSYLLRELALEGTPAQRDVIAGYVANIAILMGRMQLWHLALDQARLLTHHAILGQTPAARGLLQDSLFTPFVDAERERFLETDEIRKQRSTVSSLLKRCQAAITHAHSDSALESVGWGLVGSLTALASTYVVKRTIENTDIPLMSGAAGLASTMHRLIKGWYSEEALSAFETGQIPQRALDTAKELGTFLAARSVESASWAIPLSLSPVASDALYVMGRTLHRAGELYLDFGAWSATGIASCIRKGIHAVATPSQTMAHLAQEVSSSSSTDLAQALYKTYLGASALQYVGYLLIPNKKEYQPYRDFMKKSAIWFIPGAILLGAHLGTAIAGKQDLNNRIFRSSIAVVEGLGMLLTGGIIALAKRHSVRAAGKSIWKGFWDSDHNALVAVALTVGISSAIGGRLQEKMPLNALPLKAVQGTAISISLLPIVLMISGIMKRNIELPTGFREGWEDSKGAPMLTRFAHGLIGAMAAFNTPYALNRVGRAPTLDIPSATIRTLLNWDSNLGYAVFALMNLLSTNSNATMVYPETGAVDWERDAFRNMLRAKNHDRLRDHWIKAGLRMPLSHIFMPHSYRDRFLFPLFALQRVWNPPIFPLKPQAHYFGSLYQMIAGGYYNSLDSAELAQLLQEVDTFAQESITIPAQPSPEEEAKRARALDLLRPLIQTLHMARESKSCDRQDGMTHGDIIQRFFEEHPALLELTSVDASSSPSADTPSRRRLRARVRKQVQMPHKVYVRNVLEHASRHAPSLMDQLFSKDRQQNE